MSFPVPPDSSSGSETPLDASLPVAEEESVPPPPAPVPTRALTLPAWFPPLFYLLLATLFLWRSTFAGDVFVPADMLGHVAPWTNHTQAGQLPPWNPLRWDGIAQFYPWRHFAAETVRAGTVPLWNPYQFCGTPFVANSQSAILYPGNLIFYLLPTAQAFGVSAALHLTLCGWFTYLLLRRLRCADSAALLGGVVYAYSAWQVAWLQLPTFLATSCWFPLLLNQVLGIGGQGLGKTQSPLSPVALSSLPNPQYPIPKTCLLGLTVGMLLLAGHLQIAFYGLLASSLWAIALLGVQFRARGMGAALRGLAACLGGLAFGVMLALPQLLPTLELSRVSHRVGKPTAAGYKDYTEYALPSSGLIALTLPEFFGNYDDPDNPYWGFYFKTGADGVPSAIRHNAAETAAYVGIATLLLGGLALLRGLRRGAWDRRVLFFGGLALLSLLLSLGTPLNALFYFGVPGFGQSGSPARSLVLWALAWSALAAFGLDTLLRQPPTKRETGIVLGGFVFAVALELSLITNVLRQPPPGFPMPPLGQVFEHIGLGWARLAIVTAGSVCLFLPFMHKPMYQRAAKSPSPVPQPLTPNPQSLTPATPLALLLVLADLFLVGINVNPTAPPEKVYPETPGLTFLREHIGHDRIFPLNQRWSLYKSPPAVFPPNAATVYGLRDVQGYDSLLTGQYKAFANKFARANRLGSVDASPPEVGNMVFFQDANAPLVPFVGAMFALTPSLTSEAFVREGIPPGFPTYDAEKEMAIFPLPQARPRAELVPANVLKAGEVPSLAWNEDGATRVTLTINAPVAATLLLDDQFYPGWKATLDGQPVPITRQERAPIFRAVAMPAGQHIVAFRYEPASFRVGLYLACLASLLITASLIALAKKP